MSVQWMCVPFVYNKWVHLIATYDNDFKVIFVTFCIFLVIVVVVISGIEILIFIS